MLDDEGNGEGCRLMATVERCPAAVVEVLDSDDDSNREMIIFET